MLRDSLVELIEPMLNSAGTDPLALFIHNRTHASDDRLPCLKNPRPEGAESSLTENVTSPFQAEPAHYGPPLISIYISVGYLYKDVTNPVPMARTDVLSIALEIGAIVFMMNFMFIMFVVRSFGDMLIGFLRTFPGEMKS